MADTKQAQAHTPDIYEMYREVCLIAHNESTALRKQNAALVAALREIVETDESFNGQHRYAAIARAALAQVDGDNNG